MQGYVKPIKVSWNGCIDIDCPLLLRCTKKVITDVLCIYEKPPYIIDYVEPEHKDYVGNDMIHNFTPTAIKTAVIENIFGSTSPILKVNWASLSSCANDFNELLINERGRKSLTSSALSNNGTALTIFGLTDANCSKTTVIVAGYAPTTTTFKVDDPVGFEIGDLIEIKDLVNSLRYERTLLNITDTNTFHINKVIPLQVLGAEVNQMINQIVLLANATSDTGSGTAVSISKYPKVKTSADTISVLFSISMVGG